MHNKINLLTCDVVLSEIEMLILLILCCINMLSCDAFK